MATIWKFLLNLSHESSDFDANFYFANGHIRKVKKYKLKWQMNVILKIIYKINVYAPDQTDQMDCRKLVEVHADIARGGNITMSTCIATFL